jgi:hypothetical protein
VIGDSCVILVDMSSDAEDDNELLALDLGLLKLSGALAPQLSSSEL